MHKSPSQPKSNPTDEGFLPQLRRHLELEIAAYVYDVPPGAVGTPFTSDVIRAYLDSMRKFLVEPHWEEVNICDTRQEIWTGIGTKRVCATMAEDSGYVLVFDPVDREYHLAYRGENGLGTWGIRGDAVGCFIAR